MKDMKLPMRFRVLTLMDEHEALSDQEVFDILKKEYGNEGQYRMSTIKLHLHSMQASGLLCASDMTLDEQGELIETFKITDFGRSRLSLLPKNWDPKIIG